MTQAFSAFGTAQQVVGRRQKMSSFRGTEIDRPAVRLVFLAPKIVS